MTEIITRKLSDYFLFPKYWYHTFAPAMESATHPLLLKARALFMKYGIKNLTMDDIAGELGMSKKTIYRVVENKADLVMMVMKDYLEEEQNGLDEITADAKNAVDEMLRMVEYFAKQVADINVSILFDLKKHYPATWEIYNHYRFHNALKRISDNLKKGVKEGVYRTGFDTEVIAKIYIGGIDSLLNPDYFPSKSYVFMDVYKTYLNYHLRGVVSEKGLKILEEYKPFKK